MCGIAALFSSRSLFRCGLIKNMADKIRHRGPDDEGYCLFFDREASQSVGGSDTPDNSFSSFLPYTPLEKIEKNLEKPCYAALGHRRLSIVDLSAAGHQPMCYGDLWVTYNGEVYNYLEIRQELQALGHQFLTQSDTEVILHAYKEWGSSCLQRFNGMFAFVIYDKKQMKIFAARDRFGVKPLYFWRSPEGLLAFVSEIKQLTVLPGWNPSLNGQRGYDFLNWGLIDHTRETLFRDVFQLRGGEYIEASLHRVDEALLTPVRWYDLQPRQFVGSAQAAADTFRHLLSDAVRLRLRADVDIGSCLSGGLDSSSIVCLANSLLAQECRQKTFSACSTYPRFDERAHIDKVVEKTGVEAHYVYPDPDQLLEDVSEVLWHQDEPYPTTSIYAQWLVFKLVKDKQVKVMLDGQGADEQLAGYQGFFGNRLYDLFTGCRFKEFTQELSAIKKMHPHTHPWLLLLNKLVPDMIRQPVRRLMGRSSTGPHWLDMSLIEAEDQHPCPLSAGKSLQGQSMQQLLHTSLPMLLHFEDRDSMAHSVESRTPFLDYRLVEFCLGLPGEYKISQGWTKKVMRDGLERILPEEICWRRDKMGFVTAEEEWICKEKPDEFISLIEEAIEKAQGMFKPSAKDSFLKMVAGKMPYNSVVWRQIVFGHWLELFQLKF
jgi:asparagine synthase (glutamine-hydrolysing)